jgi:HEAT repeat protein
VKLKIILLMLIFSTQVYASKPGIEGMNPGSMDSTKDILSMPFANRQSAFKSARPEAKNLEAIAFDKSQSLEMRWRAVMAMSSVKMKEARPILQKAMLSSEWFMRNAGLLAAQKIDREFATQWSEKLLSDPALVVRTAAVQTIGEIRADSLRELLWKKLYSAENFRGEESLWIRRYIVETLASISSLGDQPRFIKVLNDEDSTLYKPAIAALEKLTQKQMGEPGDSTQSRRQKWLNWWSTQKTTVN